jgi:oligopeptide/dipeptide ABC transporter ATP-binding protein
MGLLPASGRPAGGSILFEDRDLLTLDADAMRRLRGRRIAMIFQEPMTCLNPVIPVGRQIVEGIRLHERFGRRAARELAIRMLRRVGIPAAERRFADYPHQLSGGMRQRVMIAMALACGPALLIADEPTTALDVTTQAQILALLRRLGTELGMAVLFITHDLGVAAAIADEVYVMYAGRIVERAPAARLFADPRHPYTQALLRCAPRLGRRERLEAIPGAPPARPGESPGCRFEPRCTVGAGDQQCRTHDPRLESVADIHEAACWKTPGYPVNNPPAPEWS